MTQIVMSQNQSSDSIGSFGTLLTGTGIEIVISFLSKKFFLLLTGKSLMNDKRFLHTGNKINIQLKFNIAADPRATGKPV